MINRLMFLEPDQDPWSVIEGELRNQLRARAADESMTTAVLARMREFFRVTNIVYEVPADLPVPPCASLSDRAALLLAHQESFNAFRLLSQDHTNRLLIERFNRECEVHESSAGS